MGHVCTRGSASLHTYGRGICSLVPPATRGSVSHSISLHEYPSQLDLIRVEALSCNMSFLKGDGARGKSGASSYPRIVPYLSPPGGGQLNNQVKLKWRGPCCAGKPRTVETLLKPSDPRGKMFRNSAPLSWVKAGPSTNPMHQSHSASLSSTTEVSSGITRV
jgi:hypothetical protein